MRDKTLRTIYNELQDAYIDIHNGCEVLVAKHFAYNPNVPENVSRIVMKRNYDISYSIEWKKGYRYTKSERYVVDGVSTSSSYARVNLKGLTKMYYHNLVYFCQLAIDYSVAYVLANLRLLLENRELFLSIASNNNLSEFNGTNFEVVIDHINPCKVNTYDTQTAIETLIKSSLPSNLQITYSFVNTYKSHQGADRITYHSLKDVLPNASKMFMDFIRNNTYISRATGDIMLKYSNKVLLFSDMLPELV